MKSLSTPYYKALDFIIIFISSCSAYWLRFDTYFLPIYYFLPAVILSVVSTFTLTIAGFYSGTNSKLSTKQSTSAIYGLALSSVITITCLYFTKTGENYSRLWFASSVLFAYTSLLCSRFVLRHFFNLAANSRKILLLEGKELLYPNANVEASLVNDDSISVIKRFKLSLNSDGSPKNLLSEVTNYLEEHRKNPELKNPITEIWITHDIFSQFSHHELLEAFDDSCVTLVYIPLLPELGTMGSEQIQMISGIPTINSDFSKSRKLGRLLKLFEDQCIAWTALISLFPLFVVIATLIKVESPGPVIFKQLRYGLGGKNFLIWKFRTMNKDESNSEFKQACKNDARVTKVGKWLRRTSLDELPQLINVIGGSMSIVGPRPHPEKLNEQYRKNISQYMYRHVFKPGITGLAQIKGFRGETIDPTLMEQRVKYDLEYIKHWSVFLDIKILLLTIVSIFKAKNAY